MILDQRCDDEDDDDGDSTVFSAPMISSWNGDADAVARGTTTNRNIQSHSKKQRSDELLHETRKDRKHGLETFMFVVVFARLQKNDNEW